MYVYTHTLCITGENVFYTIGFRPSEHTVRGSPSKTYSNSIVVVVVDDYSPSVHPPPSYRATVAGAPTQLRARIYTPFGAAAKGAFSPFDIKRRLNEALFPSSVARPALPLPGPSRIVLPRKMYTCLWPAYYAVIRVVWKFAREPV